MELKSVDSFIELQEIEVRNILNHIRHIIKSVVPDAEELISYQMPAFRYYGKLVWYAAWKNHYAIYVLPNVINQFKEQLHKYELTKSAIKFPFNEPVPEELIVEIIKFAVNENIIKTNEKKFKLKNI